MQFSDLHDWPIMKLVILMIIIDTHVLTGLSVKQKRKAKCSNKMRIFVHAYIIIGSGSYIYIKNPISNLVNAFIA